MPQSMQLMMYSHGDTRTVKGPLFETQPTYLRNCLKLAYAARCLECLTQTEVDTIVTACFHPEASETLLIEYQTRLVKCLNSLAAPGYEFSTWFIGAKTFWGWFPLQG